MHTFWLASYPKSGNTWFRIFLSNLLYPEHAPVDPNHLPISNLIASARGPFEEILGFHSSLLTREESARLRPALDQIIARDWQDEICVRKAHDAYTLLPNGQPLLGEPPHFSALYILRDPWDVAVSAANHWGISIAETVDRMCCPGQNETKDLNATEQLPQQLLSWSEHVLSWANSPLDLCLIRYEDMYTDALPTFRKAVDFLQLPYDENSIEKAFRASEFKNLQKLETEAGFIESPRAGVKFFRKGIIGEGLELLATEQIEKLQEELEVVNQAIFNIGIN